MTTAADIEKRKNSVWLSDEQIEMIAEKAAVKAVSKMTDQVFREVGKGVIQRFTWILGVIAVAVYSYAYGRGWLK